MPRTPLALPLLGASVLALLFATPARAQFGAGGGVGSGGFSPPVSGGGAIPPPRAAPPPALPGTTSQQPAAPPREEPTDLPPTDALFDAIDRGDMAAARDALARGADLNGVNVLGMTPLEMSVDLSRNDITFLLLSLRGASSSARTGAVGLPPSGQVTSKAGKDAKADAANAARLAASVATARPAAAPYPEQARAKPRYAAGLATAANPQAGFLGFGASAQP